MPLHPESGNPILFSEPRVIFDRGDSSCIRIDLYEEVQGEPLPLVLKTGEVYSRGIRPSRNSKHLGLPLALFDRKLVEGSSAHEIVRNPDQILFIERLEALYEIMQQHVVKVAREFTGESIDDERVKEMNPFYRACKSTKENPKETLGGFTLTPKVMRFDRELDIYVFDAEGKLVDPTSMINKAGRLKAEIQLMAIYISRGPNGVSPSVFLKATALHLPAREPSEQHPQNAQQDEPVVIFNDGKTEAFGEIDLN